ncbi:zinc ribbon domain-containing protein [Chromobacterium violaceum]|nr:zinc ribbon domain-containing protein [Chromobacterium violaceum]
MRLVPAELWAKVKARQQAISEKSKLKQAAAGERARTGAGPKYLLSGLLKCAECGSNYVIVDRSRYGCARHKDRGAAACSNSLKVERHRMERTVLQTLKKRLLTPEALKHFKLSLSSEASRQLEESCGDVKRVGKRLDEVKRQIGRLVDSIKAGIDPTILRDELNHLQQERDVLEREYAQSHGSAPVVSDVIATAIVRYDHLIANLENLLMARVSEARELLKTLFGGSIELLPKEDGTVEAKMAGMAAGLFSLFALTPDFLTESQINVVAGAGFEPTTFGL